MDNHLKDYAIDCEVVIKVVALSDSIKSVIDLKEDLGSVKENLISDKIKVVLHDDFQRESSVVSRCEMVHYIRVVSNGVAESVPMGSSFCDYVTCIVMDVNLVESHSVEVHVLTLIVQKAPSVFVMD